MHMRVVNDLPWRRVFLDTQVLRDVECKLVVPDEGTVELEHAETAALKPNVARSKGPLSGARSWSTDGAQTARGTKLFQ